MRTRQEATIFVVSFGVWDIWSLISKDYDTAKESVERRIATVITQLDLLAKHWNSESELKVIVTQAVDVTFLPGYEQADTDYKDTVRTVELWNKKLREAATAWEGGTVYLFDMNGWMVDRIRDWQLYAAGIEEENGLGKNEQGWENVVEPCVESGFRVMMSKGKACEEPGRYLFW
jgi:HMG box factor